MIRLDPAALYSYSEVVKLLGWCERTVRTAARRIGKKPYTKFFTGEEVKRMAVGVLLLSLSACATPIRRPCEFTLKVRVLDAYNADFECRRLGVHRADNGDFIKDTDMVRGCAPVGMIVSSGTQDNLGHELLHAVEANCK